MLKTLRLCLLILLTSTGAARAELPWDFADNTKYLAIGDSLAAGYGAFPVTLGYAYLLYHGGAYDKLVNTSFANAAVPSATSADVLKYQVPQAVGFFRPHVVTLSAGGNDLLTLLTPPPPGQEPPSPEGVIAAFAGNLFQILSGLCTMPELRRIYVGNLYSIENFPDPRVAFVIALFNQQVTAMVAVVNPTCEYRIKVADVHAAFSGNQEGLLLINRPGASPTEVHPSNAGHRAMAAAFRAAR